MTGLDTIRESMAAYLGGQGVTAVTAWNTAARVRHPEPVVSVSIRACSGEQAGFGTYLGERYSDEKGTWEELYGKKVTVKLGLDLYASRESGESACAGALERLTGAIAGGGPDGLSILRFEAGELSFDEKNGLFRWPVEAECQAWLYAAAAENGVFTDFTVKGTRT